MRARLVSHPADHPWSSYLANGRGAAGTLVTPHPKYLALGDRAETRQAAYRKLFRGRLSADVLAAIRHATNGKFALGDARSQAQAAARLGRRVTPGKPGRARLVKTPASGDPFRAGSD